MIPFLRSLSTAEAGRLSTLSIASLIRHRHRQEASCHRYRSNRPGKRRTLSQLIGKMHHSHHRKPLAARTRCHHAISAVRTAYEPEMTSPKRALYLNRHFAGLGRRHAERDDGAATTTAGKGAAFRRRRAVSSDAAMSAFSSPSVASSSHSSWSRISRLDIVAPPRGLTATGFSPFTILVESHIRALMAFLYGSVISYSRRADAGRRHIDLRHRRRLRAPPLRETALHARTTPPRLDITLSLHAARQ